MPIVTLGNTAPISVAPDADPVELTAEDRAPVVIDNGEDHNHTETTFHVPDGIGIVEQLSTISQVYRSHHSDEAPAWVESDDEDLAKLVSKEFSTADNKVEIGKPKDW